MQSSLNTVASTSSSFVDTIVDRRKPIAVALALFVLAGAAYSVYVTWRENQNQKAASATYDAMQKLERIPPGEGGQVDTAWAQKAAEPLKELETVAAQHKGTVPAYEAFMKLGDVNYQTGDYARAAGFFERAVDGAPTKFFKAMALYSQGMALEGMKDYKKALERFNSALSIGEPGLKGELLMALARNSLAAGDGARAKDYYGRVEADFPSSAVAMQAQRLKAEIH
jgi:tetratricopeptide (TPR) repeat protein